MAFQPGEIISYQEMCLEESTALQRGMNYRLQTGRSVLLMSRTANAPYDDQVDEENGTLIYEGHDAQRTRGGLDPKSIDQPEFYPSGEPTPNGQFREAAERYRVRNGQPLRARVYEKLRPGVWVYNGVFELVESWREQSGPRLVFKFKLRLAAEQDDLVSESERRAALPHTRVIPSAVKSAVWIRDAGRCVLCGSKDNLHFDHDLPFSKGGSSLLAENVRLLCARHNLQKSDKII